MTKVKFGSLLLLFQGILLNLCVVFVDYGDDFLPSDPKSRENHKKPQYKPPVFQDVHVMVFLGFGLIMTFLRRYSRGMLVHSFLIGGLVIQWATLLQGLFSMENKKVLLTLSRMLNADYAVMAVLISFGALMGKCNSLQLLITAMLETFFFAVNEAILLRYLDVSDNGRAIVVHIFGAYFGLAVSRMIFSRKVCMSQALSMSSKSEMYSFIGTLFLWVYWPSMNAAFVSGSAHNRAIANTYYALAASCLSAFSFTVLQSKESKFNILHLQNATLAGGVSIAAVAAMLLKPWYAIIIGVVGALSSVLTYKFIMPALRRHLKIHDTRGIHAAHGVPGIVSALASIVVAIMANESKFKASLYDMYPARVPKQNTTQYLELQKFSSFPPGEGRTALMQGMYQLGGLVCTLAVAIFGGVLTGFIIRIKFFEPVKVNDAFDDHVDFDEANCIDVSSEPEYEDDDERHHDSIHGTTRLIDDHHSDIVADNNVNMTHFESKRSSVANSIDRSLQNLHGSKGSYHILNETAGPVDEDADEAEGEWIAPPPPSLLLDSLAPNQPNENGIEMKPLVVMNEKPPLNDTATDISAIES